MITPDTSPRRAPEPEHEGSIWTHPYMIYIWITAVLAIFLGIMAYLAWTEGWIPQRNI